MESVDFSFYIYSDTMNRLTFFTMLDIVVLLIWTILLFGIAFYKRSQHSDLDYYKYYLPHFAFKVFFGFVFALLYIFYYGGGDTTAYWELGNCMNKLFWKSPELYFQELFADATSPSYINHYDETTGLPPYWILREKQGFFMSKIVSLFTFVTASSYLSITLFFAVFSANASWRFFELVRKIVPHTSRWFIYGVLFIPSVAFWCTGVSKDTMVLISILTIVTHVFKLMKNLSKSKIWSFIVILFHIWLLYKIRSVMIMVLFVPLFIAMSSQISKRFKDHVFFQGLVRGVIIGVSLLVFFFVLQSYGEEISLDKYIKEAEVVQKDFLNNAAYTGKKYTLEVTGYSATGLLIVFPAAVTAGLFRPFPWEALSPTLFLNGFESAVLLFLTFRFFIKNRKRSVSMIRKNDFFIFCFFLVLIFGFITGFSSIIFGVLVRLRAPLLIFLIILLTIPPEEKVVDEKVE